jgi:YHS domain-containing protein
MSGVLPEFDPNTRTLKVRLEVANPDYTLRPDMFVDVEFKVKVNATLAVPAEAVLDSGLRKTVFVERGDGYFEPRKVETGPRLGDLVVITGGLEPGERIVVSGNFLIDSESRFQLAAASAVKRGQEACPTCVKTGQEACPRCAPAAGKSKDPVCGMDLDTANPRHQAAFNGITYTFCSDSCLRKFTANPGMYIQEGGHPQGPS